MSRQVLFFIITNFHFFCYCQNWNWVYPVSNTFGRNISIQADSAGNGYFAGQIMPQGFFEASNGTFNGGALRPYFVKYDKQGNIKVLAGGYGKFVAGYSFFIDPWGSGNSYFTGTFGDTISFGIGPDTVAEISSNQTTNLFLTKHDSTGKCNYVHQEAGPCDDVGLQIIPASATELYLLKYVEYSCPPGYGWWNYPLSKINSLTGSTHWTIPKLCGIGADQIKILNTRDGGFLFCGRFQDSCRFFGLHTSLLLSCPNTTVMGIFLVKYDAAGELSWGKKIEHAGFFVAADVDIHSNITLGIAETPNYDPVNMRYENIIFPKAPSHILRIDSNGNYLTRADLTIDATSMGEIHSDRFGNIYFGAKTTHTFVLNSDTLRWFPSTPGSIISIIKTTPELTYISSNYFTGNTNGNVSFAITDSIIYAGGFFDGILYFNIGNTTHTTTESVLPGSVMAAMPNRDNNIVSMSEISQNSTSFHIFPNPTRDGLKVSYHTQTTKNLSLSVTNQLGQTILSRQYQNKNSISETMDVRSLARGIYFVQVLSDQATEVKKVIIE
ncbi:MAG: C-terminal target protein [Bacteroidota bacterium]|jgi:hypothetical protein|nr:C-terminal target protein [Bacteroidota bacterium]